MKLPDLKSDFEFIRGEVEGVLLFGSVAKGELTTRSDIDIALVSPSTRRVLFSVFERVGGKYDTKLFDDLPLKLFRKKKFYQKPVSLVKLFLSKKEFLLKSV